MFFICFNRRVLYKHGLTYNIYFVNKTLNRVLDLCRFDQAERQNHHFSWILDHFPWVASCYLWVTHAWENKQVHVLLLRTTHGWWDVVQIWCMDVCFSDYRILNMAIIRLLCYCQYCQWIILYLSNSFGQALGHKLEHWPEYSYLNYLSPCLKAIKPRNS